MQTKLIAIGEIRVEILTEGDRFLGLGQAWIGDTRVRSGRLPLRPYTESFIGAELVDLTLQSIRQEGEAVRVSLAATFRASETKLLRDHSFDPIHETGDWDTEPLAGTGAFTLVLQPATDHFNGVDFHGFSYHYEYTSATVPLFYIMDKASWELDGDITGATVYNQSACSDPVVTFAPETAWSTEGLLFFLVENGDMNPVMTHNLPRWADHQWFDYQWKGDTTLIGVYAQVNLIRSLLKREPGKAELKHFDKHIFDEAFTCRTTPKAILLNTTPKTVTDQQNLWTWIFDETAHRARAEFGLQEAPPVPFIGHHHWVNFTIDTYYKDILPAAEAIGAQLIFAENFKRSDYSEPNRLPNGNMCGSQEYELAPSLGGTAKFKEYIDRCHARGIRNHLWTNTYVSRASMMHQAHHTADAQSWFMAMEDARLRYGGAYTDVSSNLDLKEPEVQQYWIDCHRRIVEETGCDGFFIDSHYNLFFMPVNYVTGHPRTSWRESLQVMKALQDAGAEWSIESFGPFGMNIHGHVDMYDVSKIFICYTVGLGNNYATVPVPGIDTTKNVQHDAAYVYYQLAHKVPCPLPLFIDGQRIDVVYGEEHRRVLREYHTLLPAMHTRYLQSDGQAVLWHNATGDQATLWNFVARTVALPGTVTDLTTGETLPDAACYALQAMHTYVITGCALPTCVMSDVSLV